MTPPSQIWFVTGSQHLYGPEALEKVAENSQKIVDSLNGSGSMSHPIVAKPLLTDPEAIRKLCLDANTDPQCAGLILWMHTFSPAKMWIGGLTQLRKPVCHFHTQFNRDLPWSEIDMDFMNLNQAAHGDREAGHLHTRIGLRRKVIVGHWSDHRVLTKLDAWCRVAHAWKDLQGAKFCRFGDNMRQVSVTEGDKVSAEITFGFSVNGYGVGDLRDLLNAISDSELDQELEKLYDTYFVETRSDGIRDAVQISMAIERFLVEGRFKGFTTTFEDLHDLRQLPGLAAQLLMAKGYGFGAEGDWKTAALLRFMKSVDGDSGATSFMEDYTYHLDPDRPLVLGAHMLEICPSIAATRPRVEVHPLGIGGKEDPARLVFDAKTGPALNASLIDLGHRFRLIVNEVEAVAVPQMPKLPVARAVWDCKPSFETAVSAWIYAGGAHHTAFSYTVTTEQLRDFAEIAGIEIVVIDADTKLETFRNELRWNQASFRGHG
jgi:L-arabinose isomerase